MSIMQRIAGAVYGPRIVRPAIAAAFAALCCLAGGLGAIGSVAVAQAASACSNQALRTGASASLPDCRAWELVSPANKGLVAYVGGYLGNQVGFQASSDGQRVFYPLVYGQPDVTAGGPPRYLADRPETGWTSVQLSPPTLIPSPGTTQTGVYQFLAPDLSCGFLASIEPLAADAPQAMVDSGNPNLFRRNPDGSYTTVTTQVPSNPHAGSGSPSPYAIKGATSDCDTVVFASDHDYPGIGASSLYEWSAGSLSNVGVLPDGSVAQDARAGFQGAPGFGLSDRGSVWHAVSDDASRIFFTATSDQGGDLGNSALFVRMQGPGGASTVDVSQSQTAVVDNGAFFQLASRSGDHVLFLANYGIASSSSAGPTSGQCTDGITAGAVEPCDLYDYNVNTGELDDLSADSNPLDTNGAVVAGVLGASDDASRVYFAAEGQLVAGKGRTYAQNDADDSFNIYLTYDGQLSFVGLLDKADLVGDPSGALIGRSGGNGFGSGESWRSRTTPDGRRLLFSSSANVTGYDSGGVAEAYLYSAGSDSVTCISCRTDGDLSVGVVATSTNPKPTAPLPPVSGVNVLNPARALAEDGSRVFFTMPDALAHGAVEGALNIYEWEDGQVHLLTTGPAAVSAEDPGPRFVGTSTTGDDVFITTSGQLAPQDPDARTDLYDARVDGGFPVPAAPAASCVGSQCQGAPRPTPGGSAPATAVFRGPGNVNPASSASVFHVRGIGRRKRRRLAAGKRVGLVVRVSEPGRVRASVRARLRHHGRVRVVAHGSKRAGRAGSVRVHLRLSRRARRHLRHHRLRIAIRVRYSRVDGVQHARLTLRPPGAHSSRRGARRARQNGNRSRGARR